MVKKSLREGSKIVFADGEEREIFPLTIRQLRKFMATVKGMQQSEEGAGMEEGDIDLMVQAVGIALEKVDPELAKDQDALEDAIDVKVFNLVLAAAMGVDPNV